MKGRAKTHYLFKNKLLKQENVWINFENKYLVFKILRGSFKNREVCGIELIKSSLLKTDCVKSLITMKN